MNAHSPEPWRTSWEHESVVELASGDLALSLDGKWTGSDVTVAKVLLPFLGEQQTMRANARRIVACVNACAGISTEALEAKATEIKGR